MASITVAEIATKVLAVPDDEDGNLEFAIKAVVTNHGSDPEELAVELQGIDAEGFELANIFLTGTVLPGQSRTLTNRGYESPGTFRQIVCWQVRG